MCARRGHACALGTTWVRSRSSGHVEGHARALGVMRARSGSRGRALREDGPGSGVLLAQRRWHAAPRLPATVCSARRGEAGGVDGLLKAPWRGGPLRSPWRLPGDPREQDVSRLECCLPAPSPGHGVASLAFRRPGPCQMERRCHLRPLLVPTGTSAISECRWSAPRTPARTVSDFAGSVLSCVGPVGARWRVQHRPGPASGTVDGAAAARLVVPQAASGSWNGGTTGGAEPWSLRREPRRGRSRVGGAPAHTQVRRASCFVSAAAALACGLQPQDRGDCCVFTLQAGAAVRSISPACRVGGFFGGRVFAGPDVDL